MSIAKRFTIAAIAAVAPLAAKAGTLTTLYTFTGGADEGNAYRQLIFRNGALYGVASDSEGDLGTVFKFDLSAGKLTEVYNFKGVPDGAYPADLIYHSGTFYGTTLAGGVNDSGTVFALDAGTRSETVLYSFPNLGNDSSASPGGLIYENGMLYGISEVGGGEVFTINPNTGAEASVYRFTFASGANVIPSLTFKNGLLYGAAQFGGNQCRDGYGCGTVFSVNPTTGAGSTLYAFTHGAGGNWPYPNLVYHDGSLFGATVLGGNKTCKLGCGVGFAINAATGAETVLNKYKYDDETPYSQTAVGGKDYETIYGGNGFAGQLVELDLKSGHHTVLYTFTGGNDGANPAAPLLYENGTFYGTTTDGAHSGCANHFGCGTIFKYVP